MKKEPGEWSARVGALTFKFERARTTVFGEEIDVTKIEINSDARLWVHVCTADEEATAFLKGAKAALVMLRAPGAYAAPDSVDAFEWSAARAPREASSDS